MTFIRSTISIVIPAIFLLVTPPVFADSKPIFEDKFTGTTITLPDGSRKIYPDPTKWGFTFWPGMKWADSYGDGTNWLNNNGESQVYLTSRLVKVKGRPVHAPLRYDPFSIQKDGLHITAAKLSPAQQEAYQVGGHRRFGSGMLLSRTAFKYGKVRVIAQLPSARGSWPAIWLLPARPSWPPEIDILEGMAWGPHTQEIHSGFIPLDTEKPHYPDVGDWYDVGVDPSKGFHEYGMDWSEKTIRMTFDGKLLWESPTPPSMKQDMNLLINLAVGGKWVANELGIKPTDSLAPERLGRASDLIESDYPASLIIKSVTILRNN